MEDPVIRAMTTTSPTACTEGLAETSNILSPRALPSLNHDLSYGKAPLDLNVPSA